MTEQQNQTSLSMSQEGLMSVLRAAMGWDGGLQDPDNPLPPGPWDPVVRSALERSAVSSMRSVPWDLFGPHPEPWKLALASILSRHPEIYDVLNGGGSLADMVALNPQPLPPRSAFLGELVQTVVSRVEMMQEIAGSLMQDGTQSGIIIVGGYINRFLDDWCGNGFRIRYPFPGPRPHWFTNELNGLDLVVMAMHFDQAARESFNAEVGHELAAASAKLMEAGMSRMQ